MKEKNFFSSPIAHRGLHGESVPENSLLAFRRAMRYGYSIETDVRMTKDNKLVLFHDENLLRMTGANRLVSDCTLEELRSYPLSGSNEFIPTLDELLGEISVPLLLEIKPVKENANSFLKKIARTLSEFKGELFVQSFQPLYLLKLKKWLKGVPFGVLATAVGEENDFSGDKLWRIKNKMVRNMSFNFLLRPDFVSYEKSGVSLPVVQKFRGVKLAWVVRNEEEEKAVSPFVDQIIFENYLPK